jgi:hypothetical protein
MAALITSGLLIIGAASTAGAEEKAAPKGAKGDQSSSLQQRIDFGNAYILGQSIKSGAVYLLHRKQSEIKGMLEVRQDYRDEIMEDYGLEKTAIVPARKQEVVSEAPDEPRAAEKKLQAKKQ